MTESQAMLGTGGGGIQQKNSCCCYEPGFCGGGLARIRAKPLPRWWTTADLAEVRRYEIQDAGHRWPGNLGNPEISTAAEICNFIQRYRPP